MKNPLPAPHHAPLAKTLLLGSLLALAACGPGSVATISHVSPLSDARATPAPAHGHRPPAYFGDEYADAQRALLDRPDEPAAPTF